MRVRARVAPAAKNSARSQLVVGRSARTRTVWVPPQGRSTRPTGGRSATARIPRSPPADGGGTRSWVGLRTHAGAPLRAHSRVTAAARESVSRSGPGARAPTVVLTVEVVTARVRATETDTVVTGLVQTRIVSTDAVSPTPSTR